ncbi:MAG: TolC family protein [Fibrobacterota bacterium]
MEIKNAAVVLSLVFISHAASIGLDEYVDSVYAGSERVTSAQLNQRKWQAKQDAFEREFYPQLYLDGTYAYRPQWSNIIPGYSSESIYDRYLDEADFISGSGQVISELVDERFYNLFENPPSHMFSLGISFEQPLWFTHTRREDFDILKEQARYSICEWQLVQMKERAKATKLYYRLLLVQNTAAVYSSLVAQRKEYHENMVAQYERGITDPYDTLSSYLEYITAKTDLETQEYEKEKVTRKFIELGNLSGADDEIILTDELVPRDYSVPIELMKEQILVENKDLLQGDITVEMAKTEVRKAEKLFWPEVHWGVRFSRTGYMGRDHDFSFRPDKEVYLGMRYKLFSFGARIEKLNKARYSERIASLLYEAGKREIFGELEDLYAEYRKTMARLQSFETALSAAEQMEELARMRHSDGIISREELEKRRHAVAMQKLKYARAVYQQNIAVIDLRLLLSDYLYDTRFFE